jgi:hypothetical protein
VIDAADLCGRHVQGTLWHADRTEGRWINLTGEDGDAWSTRLTPESEFVHVPAPMWVTITMVTHKKNGQVVVRTIVPEEGYLSERNLTFAGTDSIRVAERPSP